ncbi:hypothetical protein ILUMI_12560, partial [Ignelater luminosus]
EQNARRRLQFCEENALPNWELAIFSDEKTFCSSEDYTKTLWRSGRTGPGQPALFNPRLRRGIEGRYTSVFREWFAQRPEITSLDWPAQFLDFNPVENFGLLLFDNGTRNREKLRNDTIRAWNGLRRSNICEKLVNSMPRRLQQCIEVNGYYTKY